MTVRPPYGMHERRTALNTHSESDLANRKVGSAQEFTCLQEIPECSTRASSGIRMSTPADVCLHPLAACVDAAVPQSLGLHQWFDLMQTTGNARRKHITRDTTSAIGTGACHKAKQRFAAWPTERPYARG